MVLLSTMRTTICSRSIACSCFELLVGELPSVRSHAGPPLWNRVNADKFREKHLAERTTGPYIDEGRYEMEVPREYTTAKSLLSSQETPQTASHGKHVRQSLEKRVDSPGGCRLLAAGICAVHCRFL